MNDSSRKVLQLGTRECVSHSLERSPELWPLGQFLIYSRLITAITTEFTRIVGARRVAETARLTESARDVGAVVAT